MKRKDKHIDKFLRDPLPEPEIRADDAWAAMSDMLDATPNDEANRVKGPAQFWKSIGKLKGLLIAISAVVTVSAVVALLVLNNNKTGNRQTAPSAIPAEQGSAADAPRVSDDTNEKSKIATHRKNSGALTETDSVPGRVKTGLGSTENAVKGGHPDQKVAERIPAKPTGTQSKIPDNTGPTRNSSPTRKPDAHESVTSGRNTYSRVRERQTDITLPDVLPQSGNTRNSEKSTQFPATNQTAITPVSHEKTTSTPSAGGPFNSLEPLPGHFTGTPGDLSKLVQKPALNEAPPAPKKQASLFANLHFGPEWTITRSIVSPNYMFTGADSTKQPLRLAIPGIFVSKSWNRHTATFIFNPSHSYFGDKERVAQRVDTIPSPDSTMRQVNRNTNFIKAFGLNFSLQYQYHVVRGLSLVGGLSYARYSSALLRKETEYPNGSIGDQAYLTARGNNALRSYMNTEQWSIRAGILFYSRGILNNRLQVAWMTIIPVSNLSLTGFKKVKTPNAQLSIRFLIK